jgi:signal recognition particle subunit SRP54
MFDNLSDKLDKAFHILKGHGKITEINVAETLKEVRRALLDADVNFKIAKDFTTRVKDKAIGQNVLTTLQPGQLLVKLVKDELTELMGGEVSGVNLSGNPTVILMSGLQGSGKTTFSGKLANYLKTKKSKNPLLVACDVYRPAAINQLHVVGSQIGVEVYSELGNNNPVEIAQNAVKYAKEKGYNVVIVDTAGRLAIDAQMMDEIARVHKAIQPQETLFVNKDRGFSRSLDKMWLLSNCQHHVFNNSTFYWWGATLSKSLHGGVPQQIYCADNFLNPNIAYPEWKTF